MLQPKKAREIAPNVVELIYRNLDSNPPMKVVVCDLSGLSCADLV